MQKIILLGVYLSNLILIQNTINNDFIFVKLLMHPKENYPLTRNPQNKRYSYSHSLDQQNTNPNSSAQECSHHKNASTSRDLIAQLEERLKQQEEKYRKLQETTIREQMYVLEQINLLEDRFTQVTREKEYFKKEYEGFKSEICEYKKIKGVSVAMRKMMKKVEGEEGDLHTAWKWVKKVVMEHQAIKQKAFEWKRGYDAFMAMTSIVESETVNEERQQTFSSVDSDSLDN